MSSSTGGDVIKKHLRCASFKLRDSYFAIKGERCVCGGGAYAPVLQILAEIKHSNNDYSSLSDEIFCAACSLERVAITFGGNHHCCPVCQPEAACQLEREEGYLRGGMIEEDGDRTNCVMCCVCVCREKTGSFSIPHSCFMHTGMSPGFNYRGSNWSRCVSVCVLVHAHTHYIYPFSPSTCKLHAFGPCGDSVSAKQLCMLMVMWLWLADTF